MFDQVMKRSNWVWIYKMGRFAEERSAYLSDLNEQGHSMHTLRNVNKFSLAIAEGGERAAINGSRGSADRASGKGVGCEVMRPAFQNRDAQGRYQTICLHRQELASLSWQMA